MIKKAILFLGIGVALTSIPAAADAQNMIATSKFDPKRSDTAPHANRPGFGSSFFADDAAKADAANDAAKKAKPKPKPRRTGKPADKARPVVTAPDTATKSDQVAPQAVAPINPYARKWDDMTQQERDDVKTRLKSRHDVQF